MQGDTTIGVCDIVGSSGISTVGVTQEEGDEQMAPMSTGEEKAGQAGYPACLVDGRSMGVLYQQHWHQEIRTETYR